MPVTNFRFTVRVAANRPTSRKSTYTVSLYRKKDLVEGRTGDNLFSLLEGILEAQKQEILMELGKQN